MTQRSPLDCSIVIPTRDRRESLVRCLAAIARQDTSRTYEVIVVDDGSDPPVQAVQLPRIAQMRVVRMNGSGPARARNAGILAAAAPLVLFTDDDTEPFPGWVEAACEFMERNPDCAGVEGATESPAWDYLHAHSVSNEVPGHYMTANIGYRRTDLLQIGGFWSGFPDPHCEEVDLALRLLRRRRIGFEPRMGVLHHPRLLTKRELMRRGRLASSEVVLYVRNREHFGLPAWLPPRVFPVLNFAAAWWAHLRREGARLLTRPRRAARFTVVAAGQIAEAIAAVATLGKNLGRPLRDVPSSGGSLPPADMDDAVQPSQEVQAPSP